MEEATRRHFFFHGKPGRDAEKSKCHFCQLRSFTTHPLFPVTIVNMTGDNAILPPSFEFISRSVYGKGVLPAQPEFRTGCTCDEDGVGCQYGRCECLQELEDEDSDDDDESGGEEDSQTLPPENYGDESEDDDFQIREQMGIIGAGVPKRGRERPPGSKASATARAAQQQQQPPRKRLRRKAYAYHTHGAKAGQLRRRIREGREPIYECHASCSCSPSTCPNRTVSLGRRVPLQIFRTANGRGWGVRSTVDIPTGQFVDTYNGELLTPAETSRRRAHSTVAQRKDVYLFALDKFSDPASPDERLRGAPIEVDGEFRSGPTRFVNHSCDPNLRIFARVGDHADKHIHDLALFAIRPILKGEELTFDYVDGVDEAENDALDPDKKKDMTVCLCGSEKCRGYLW